MEQFFRVGIFSSTHGLKGEISVFPTTDELGRFKTLTEVYMDTREGRKALHVEKVRFQKGMALVKFKEYNDINEIERFKGSSIFVDRAHAARLEEGRFFIADLIGLKVVTDEGRELGILTDVLQTGANDVFVVEGMKDGAKKEYLLPHIKPCVLNISLEEGLILVHMMDGLEDL